MCKHFLFSSTAVSDVVSNSDLLFLPRGKNNYAALTLIKQLTLR